MSDPRIIDVRHADNARPGQQQQTVENANASLEMIDGATCVVLISYVPKDGGGFVTEVAVAGSGPRGFGGTVAGTLRACAEPVGAAMTRQERTFGEVGES